MDCSSGARPRRRLAALLLAQHHHQMVAQVLPHAGFQEGAEVAVDRRPGRKGRRGRQVAPLAAGPHHVEQDVQEATHVGGAGPSAGLG